MEVGLSFIFSWKIWEVGLSLLFTWNIFHAFRSEFAYYVTGSYIILQRLPQSANLKFKKATDGNKRRNQTVDLTLIVIYDQFAHWWYWMMKKIHERCRMESCMFADKLEVSIENRTSRELLWTWSHITSDKYNFCLNDYTDVFEITYTDVFEINECYI